MSEDLTKTPLPSDSEKLTLILKTVQSLTVRADSVDSRLNRFEETLEDVRPVWQLVVTDVAHLRDGQLLLEKGQRRLEEQFGHLEERFGHLEGRFGHLEGRLDEQCGRLEEGLEGLRSEVKEFRRFVDYRFLVLSGTVLDRYNKLEQRVTHLELNSNPPNTET